MNPAPVNPYSYNVNTFDYPKPHFSYPVSENKAKKPQVTTPTLNTVSTQPSIYVSKSTESPESYTSKPNIDIRLKEPVQPENNNGQKTIELGKNDLLTPSSGSSGYSSSLTPQYVNSPTNEPTNTVSSNGQETNLVVLSSSKLESSTPLYSVSTKTIPQPKSSNSIEPSSTETYENQFSTISPDSSTPVNIIPYPLPIVPNPGSCPCYFVPSSSNSTNQQYQQPTFDLNNLPEGAVIGFVPVVFYPSCGQSASKDFLSSKLEPVFPSAYQVPYKCSYCEQTESQPATIKNSFDQVVKQSQLGPSVLIKSPSRKSYPNAPIFDQQEFGKRIRVVKRKSKDENN